MKELAHYFLYLGATGFGGPIVLIQLMRQHYVEKNKMMSASEFDQTFALIKAMPGPVAFQMAVFLGQKFQGRMGGLVAGICLLLPAFILMLVAGLFYQSFTQHLSLHAVMTGLLYAASAVILFSLKGLLQGNKKFPLFWVFLLSNVFIAWWKLVPEPFLIIGFGLLAILFEKIKSQPQLMAVTFFFIDIEKLIPLFKICTYAGAFVFGTGFALMPVLKSHLVDVHQFISLKEFNDGIVFGQMTPGPITITATFLGYQISGFAGALVATIGVFLFPLIHILTWFPKAMSWMSRQAWISHFVMGATAAVVAGILVTLVQMNIESFQQWSFWVLFLFSCGVLYLRPKVSVIGLFIVAGLAELLFRFAA